MVLNEYSDARPRVEETWGHREGHQGHMTLQGDMMAWTSTVTGLGRQLSEPVKPTRDWPSSPCMIKNTFLHFVSVNEAEEPADDSDLKGKACRRRHRSEPPARSPKRLEEPCWDDQFLSDSDGTTTAEHTTDPSPATPVTRISADLPEYQQYSQDFYSDWDARMWQPIAPEGLDMYNPYAAPLPQVAHYDEVGPYNFVPQRQAPHVAEYQPVQQGLGLPLDVSVMREPQRTEHQAWPDGPCGSKEDPMPWDDVVTVMVRQVPRRYSQIQILEKLSQRGFKGVINFLYLPFDMKKGINVGYCFVGFTEHCHALRFRKAFDGAFLDKAAQAKDKPLRVHPASVQGYAASVQHFSRTKTGNKQDRRFSPLFLGADGHIPPAACLRGEADSEIYDELQGGAQQETSGEHYGSESWSAPSSRTWWSRRG